jgi:hypothetical protein
VLAGAIAAGFAGCDPFPSSGAPGAVAVDLSLDSQGGADVDLFLDARVRSNAELTALGEQIAPLLFPTASRRIIEIDDNSGGYPFVHIAAAGAYRPGRHPKFTFDARPAVTALLAEGFKSVDLNMGVPFTVPSTDLLVPAADPRQQDTWAWNVLASGSAAPVGSIVMAPNPWPSLIAIGLTPVSLALLGYSVLSLRRRRQVSATMAAGTAGLAAVVIFVLSSVAAPENLGVIGYLSGGWQTTASVSTSVPILIVALAALGVITTARSNRRPRQLLRFNPPPGWPPPPPGWVPTPGWTPDPTWPAAPPNWSFVDDARAPKRE